MNNTTLVKTAQYVDTHVEVTFVSVLPAGKVTIVMKVSDILCLLYANYTYTYITNSVYIFAGGEDDNNFDVFQRAKKTLFKSMLIHAPQQRDANS